MSVSHLLGFGELCVLPIFCGGAVKLFSESVCEILAGVEADAKGDVRDGPVWLIDQQVACVVEACAVELLGGCRIEDLSTGRG